MSSRQYPKTPLLAACTAIWRGNRVLLVQRSGGLNSGSWAMPGGLVETGETLEQAAIREVKEETGLGLDRVVFNRNHEIILRDNEGVVEFHYVIAMFVSRCDEGKIMAGDDAAEADWFTIEQMGSLLLSDKTEQFARESRAFLDQLT